MDHFEQRNCTVIEVLGNKYIYKCNFCNKQNTTRLTDFAKRKYSCACTQVPPIEEVQEYFSKVECEPLFETINSKNEQLKFKCVCGDITFTTFIDIKKQKLCNSCGNYKKYLKLLEYKKLFESRGCILLEKRCPGVMEKIKYICKCGNESLTTINNYKSKVMYCMDCSNKSRSHTNKDVSELLEKFGCELLGDYIPNKKIAYKCHCGEESTATRQQLFKTDSTWSGCKKCFFKTQIKDYDKIAAIFKEKGCVLLSKTYPGRHTPVDFQCVCGEIAQIRYGDLVRGKLCMNCAGERRKSTNLKVRNVENPFQDPKCQEKSRTTMVEKYGVEYSMQHPTFLKQALKTAYSTKDYPDNTPAMKKLLMAQSVKELL